MSELGDTMKITVNYELISKIGEAKIGINVHRVGKKDGVFKWGYDCSFFYDYSK